MGTLIVLSIIVAVIIIFRKQLDAGIIKAKTFIDSKTETSIKIAQKIGELKKQQKIVRGKLSEYNTSKFSNNTLLINELKTAQTVGVLRVKLIADIEGCGSEGEVFVVKGMYNNDGIDDSEFFDIGLKQCWNRIYFNVVAESKNTNRYKNLLSRHNRIESRIVYTTKLIKTIENSIVSLNNDKDYVKAMESMIEVEDFDIDININAISAEIFAIEKDLEMIDSINGNEVEPAEIINCK